MVSLRSVVWTFLVLNVWGSPVPPPLEPQLQVVADIVGKMPESDFMMEVEDNSTDNSTCPSWCCATTPTLTTTPLPIASAALGTSLAITGGILYATAAFTTSYTQKAEKEQRPGWTESYCSRMKLLSWLTMCSGGLIVTFSLMSGASVPLMNSLTYSTNLALNMVLQLTFDLSTYTKEMRVGTWMFVILAIMLGDLSPPPVTREWKDLVILTEPDAIIFFAAYLVMWVSVGLWRNRLANVPSSSPVKVFVYALFIACLGSFTDTWAKLNGTLGGVWYWVSFVIYILVSALILMRLTVEAFAATEVSLFVPANLCTQLVLNIVTGVFVWNDLDKIELPVAYFMGYLMCMLAVYVATPAADIVAGRAVAADIQAKSFSNGKSETKFGASMVGLQTAWTKAEATPEERKEAIQKSLLIGSQYKVFNTESLVNLVLGLWEAARKDYKPSPFVMMWLFKVPFFVEYMKEDPFYAPLLETALDDNEKEDFKQGLLELRAISEGGMEMVA